MGVVFVVDRYIHDFAVRMWSFGIIPLNENVINT